MFAQPNASARRGQLPQRIVLSLLSACAALALFAGATSALAAPVITEYALPTTGAATVTIVAGPDGNLWFAENLGNKIGRITPAGVVTEFAVPTANPTLYGIASGPDGNIWFTQGGGNKIGKISTTGVVTEYTIPTAGSVPLGMAVGSDGNLWFAENLGNKIGRITPGGAITEFPLPSSAPWPGVFGVVAGPDGAIWFTEKDANRIGKITTGGTITEYAIPTPASGPVGITVGADGNLWFTEFDGNKIGKITTAGAIIEYAIPSAASKPTGITAGSDGNLWFAEGDANKIGMITTAGVITEYAIPTAASQPTGITLGADGNLWFTEYATDKIGKIALSTAMTALNDTGQTQCDNGSNVMVACNAASTGDSSAMPGQDGRYGRDAAGPAKVGGGAAGFDFSRMCFNGDVQGSGNCTGTLVANNTGTPTVSPGTDWACTRDNVTGLVWSTQTLTGNWDEAITKPAPYNSVGRCGFNDWRLPTPSELLSIVNNAVAAGPMVDADYFPYTVASWYWASPAYAGDTTQAWMAYFGGGGTDFFKKDQAYYARLVRSAP